uniref:Reverse transcriptase RNase H-like domain-containing protein n=1 Tax=Romanomermis culicivorax TaxID=13658 RepID=A0A915J6Z9_ROMCU
MKVNTQTNDKSKRWYSILNQFNHRLEYVPGRQNAMADYLSRKDEPEDTKDKNPPKWEYVFKIQFRRFGTQTNDIESQIVIQQFQRIRDEEIESRDKKIVPEQTKELMDTKELT